MESAKVSLCLVLFNSVITNINNHDYMHSIMFATPGF